MTAPGPEWVTAAEAGRRLGISHATTVALCAKGVPNYLDGAHRWILLPAAERAVAARRLGRVGQGNRYPRG